MADPTNENSETLLRILFRGYESKDLDYKAACKWDETDKKSRCELVKDILAMANSTGGYLVIGVSENTSGPGYEGLTDEQAGSFDSTKINSFVQTYADPPINTHVRKVRHDERTYVVIEVPQFLDTPHICQKDFPSVLSDRTLYVRTDNNESAPIRSSADFRAIIERSIRNRADTLLQSIRLILTGGSHALHDAASIDRAAKQLENADAAFDEQNPLPDKDFDFYVRSAFVPERFSEKRFSIQQLKDAAFRAQIDFTGWPFLFIHVNRADVLSTFQDGLQTLIYTDDFFGGKILDFWRLYESGVFYKKELPHEAYPPTQHPGVAIFPPLARHFGLAIDCLLRLYDGLLEPTEAVTLRVTITGTKGRTLVSGTDALPFRPKHISQIPQIDVEQKHSLLEWKAGLQDFATEMMAEVQVRFNWMAPDTEATRRMLAQMFSRLF